MITKSKKEKKNDLRSLVFGALILLMIFGATGFFLYSNVRLKQKREDLDSKLKSLQQELQELEKQNEELKSGINRSGTESFEKEKLYEQGYVEQGAQQVVVLPPEEEIKEENPEQKNFWQKFLDNFK